MVHALLTKLLNWTEALAAYYVTDIEETAKSRWSKKKTVGIIWGELIFQELPTEISLAVNTSNAGGVGSILVGKLDPIIPHGSSQLPPKKNFLFSVLRSYSSTHHTSMYTFSEHWKHIRYPRFARSSHEDRTHISCFSCYRQMLYSWTMGEAASNWKGYKKKSRGLYV